MQAHEDFLMGGRNEAPHEDPHKQEAAEFIVRRELKVSKGSLTNHKKTATTLLLATLATLALCFNLVTGAQHQYSHHLMRAKVSLLRVDLLKASNSTMKLPKSLNYASDDAHGN